MSIYYYYRGVKSPNSANDALEFQNYFKIITHQYEDVPPITYYGCYTMKLVANVTPISLLFVANIHKFISIITAVFPTNFIV